MSKKQSEQSLQKSVIDYLRLKGFLCVKFNNTGIYNKKTGHYIPPAQKGISDIIALRNGVYHAFELKIKPNKPSEHQLAFLEEVNKHGGIGKVIYSIDEVIKILEGKK